MTNNGSLVLISNPDKKNHEVWNAERDLMDIPCPSRIAIIGSPNSGKSTLILNFLLKAKPFYKNIFLSHPALRYSGDTDPDEDDIDEFDVDVPEYKHIDFTPLYEIPGTKFFDNDCKKQVYIMDDIEMKTLDKDQKKKLNKVMSYASSHHNLTIIVGLQDPFSQLPPCVLRFTNVFILYKYNDVNYMRLLCNRIGISRKQTDKVLDEMKDYGLHDFLVIDNTVNSPCKFRKNMYQRIDFLS